MEALQKHQPTWSKLHMISQIWSQARWGYDRIWSTLIHQHQPGNQAVSTGPGWKLKTSSLAPLVPRRLVPLVPLVPPWAGRCVDKQALQGRNKPGRGPSILNSRLETMPIYSTLDLVFTENGKFIPLIPPKNHLVFTGNGKFIPPRPIPPINMVFLMVTGRMVSCFTPPCPGFICLGDQSTKIPRWDPKSEDAVEDAPVVVPISW